MTPKEIERREAWRSTLWTSVLDLGCGVLGYIAFRTGSWMPDWAMIQFAVTGGITLAVTLAWRRAPRPACLALFSINVASGLVTCLAGTAAYAFVGQVWGLYQPFKASLLIIAILSPSLPVGLAWIAIFTLAPIVQTQLWEQTIRNAVPPWEPWFMPVFGAIALVLLLYRRRSLGLERELSEARARRLSVERLAGVSLALRDLANTPLQTLTTGVGLLRHNAPDSDRVLASMERALARLEKLRHSLAPFEREWQPADESFDALARMEQMASDLTRAQK
jgi:hypothetical protein